MPRQPRRVRFAEGRNLRIAQHERSIGVPHPPSHVEPAVLRAVAQQVGDGFHRGHVVHSHHLEPLVARQLAQRQPPDAAQPVYCDALLLHAILL